MSSDQGAAGRDDLVQGGADLAGANLTGTDLTGALWSKTTQWPVLIAAEMVRRSEKVRPGVWQVIGWGSANAEVDAPRVPI